MHLCHRTMAKRISTLAFLMIAMLITSEANAQCAMCKAVAESNAAAGGGEAAGLNYGIMWLMAFPYLMMVTVGVLWYRHNKRTKAKAATE